MDSPPCISSSAEMPPSETSRIVNPLPAHDEEVSSSTILSHPNKINGQDRMLVDSMGEIPSAESLRSGRGITRRNKRTPKSSSVPSTSSSSSQNRGKGVVIKRRSPSVFRSRRSENELEVLALPLGMSFAAVIAQVLDGKDAAREKISADRLAMICTSAIKESLVNVFGNNFDSFMRNFEKSFASTLKTLQLINEASLDKGVDSLYTCDSDIRNDNTEDQITHSTHEAPSGIEEIQDNVQLNSVNHQLVLHGQTNRQLVGISHSISGSSYNHSILSTFEKSVTEQARSNDLKAFEISLIMKRLQMEESQLALSSAANFLKKFKISMGISKASFKEEKLKTQLQDTRHAEMLRHCTDCLVTGLLIMLTCLMYGTYVYSYGRIKEMTEYCTSSKKESKSWWFSNPVASVSSGWLAFRCHVIALSRLLFGVFMIFALAYSLVQRSASCRQTMPMTFILLLLGVACGLAGKLCVDTLGGSGYWWLLYWEALCLLHFFANFFTPLLFNILYGPVTVIQTTEKKASLPYWIRRVPFYSILLFLLPVLSGLMPFASPSEWKDHFLSLLSDKSSVLNREVES